MMMNILLKAAYIAMAMEIVSCGDVSVKCVHHCDLEKWIVSGPAGKTITLKYILERPSIDSFVLQYDNLTILTILTDMITNKSHHKFDFTETELQKEDDEFSFAFKVKKLNKTVHERKMLTSILTDFSGEKNETDILTISVKPKDYVPSKEDKVSLYAGIVMAVLMIVLIGLFIVLYKNDTLQGTYNPQKSNININAKDTKGGGESTHKECVEQSDDVIANDVIPCDQLAAHVTTGGQVEGSNEQVLA